MTITAGYSDTARAALIAGDMDSFHAELDAAAESRRKVAADTTREVRRHNMLPRLTPQQIMDKWEGIRDRPTVACARFILYGDLDGMLSYATPALTYQSWIDGDAPESPRLMPPFVDGLCSYGSHFPLIRRLRHGVLLINDGKYSRTTTRHQTAAKMAAHWLGYVKDDGHDATMAGTARDITYPTLRGSRAEIYPAIVYTLPD